LVDVGVLALEIDAEEVGDALLLCPGVEFDDLVVLAGRQLQLGRRVLFHLSK